MQRGTPSRPAAAYCFKQLPPHPALRAQDGGFEYVVLHNTSAPHAAPLHVNLAVRRCSPDREPLSSSDIKCLFGAHATVRSRDLPLPFISFPQDAALLRSSPAASADPSAASLRTRSHPLPRTRKEAAQAEQVQAFAAALSVLGALSYVPAAVAAAVVKERECKAKHLQLVSGAPVLAYWLSFLLGDFLLYLLTFALLMIVFAAFGVTEFSEGANGMVRRSAKRSVAPASHPTPASWHTSCLSQRSPPLCARRSNLLSPHPSGRRRRCFCSCTGPPAQQ